MDDSLSILVIAQHDNATLSADTYRTIRAATCFTSDQNTVQITVLVIGFQCDSVLDSLKQIPVINSIIVADSPCYQYQLAENCADLIAEVGKNFSHILAPATTFGKNIMPRVAATLSVGQLSDVISIESPDTFVRPIYAGNALAKVKSNDPIKVVTVRSAAFESILDADISVQNSLETEEIHYDEPIYPSQTSEFIELQALKSERPDLSSARVVISGGRGLGSKENFALVEQLADKMGGAIGASRAVVDAGFVSNDLQVGQTGKIVAPELYIAVGISGAIQHLAGMKDSKVIVAINNDPDAPIFKVADYGIVGDLFEIVPELTRMV